MEKRTDCSAVHFRDNGKLKLLILVGTRPEIIRLSEVIRLSRRMFDCLLAHTGQNYDDCLNDVFFRDLQLPKPDVDLHAVGDDLGATIGNIIDRAYKLMKQTEPDALLILGDTNSCLSAIAAKRLHIPIFHMEAGNRSKNECLPEETNRRIVDIISDVNLAYSEHARRYLAECGLPKERTFVVGSPMAEVLGKHLDEIERSDIHARLHLKKKNYILLSAHREENIDTEANFRALFTAINCMAEKYDIPVLYSCHPRAKKRLETSGFRLDHRVILHEPLGFYDYNCLQMHAFAVVSDSGSDSGLFSMAAPAIEQPETSAIEITTSTKASAIREGVFFIILSSFPLLFTFIYYHICKRSSIGKSNFKTIFGEKNCISLKKYREKSPKGLLPVHVDGFILRTSRAFRSACGAARALCGCRARPGTRRRAP